MENSTKSARPYGQGAYADELETAGGSMLTGTALRNRRES